MDRSISLSYFLVFALIESVVLGGYGCSMTTTNTSKRRRLTADDRKLVRQIRLFRKQRGWTQEELSEKVQKNPNFITSIENFKRGISFVTVQKIAKVFGVNLKDLL